MGMNCLWRSAMAYGGKYDNEHRALFDKDGDKKISEIVTKAISSKNAKAL